MTIGERIKELRKDNLKLTLDGFGEKIGLKRSALSLIENGQRGVTDQTVNSICREFNVNEEWLRTGEGDPFMERSREEQVRDYFSDLEGLNEELKDRLLDALAAIRPEDWRLIEQLVNRIVAEGQRDGQAPPAAEPPADTPLTPEERDLLRQFREKKNQADGSSASSAG